MEQDILQDQPEKEVIEIKPKDENEPKKDDDWRKGVKDFLDK